MYMCKVLDLAVLCVQMLDEALVTYCEDRHYLCHLGLLQDEGMMGTSPPGSWEFELGRFMQVFNTLFYNLFS